MLSLNNFIFTEKGKFKLNEFYEDYIGRINNNNPLIKIATLDTANLTYVFTDEYRIERTPDKSVVDLVKSNIQEFQEVFECKFSDLFTNRTITVNCTEDTYILQYNIIRGVDIVDKRYGILQYIEKYKDNKDLDIGYRQIKSLINFSTHMPNIAYGDTAVKYVSKTITNREICFRFNNGKTDTEYDTVPVFASQDMSNFDNFILVKDNPKL